MPAKSEAMKTMACVALGYKNHGVSALKSMDEKGKKAAIKWANSMTEDELKDFCLQPVKE
ncbi:MAG: hypothetical protein MUP81_06630 [Dehalococcoidia bacterium]|nr:hypothetical protein [Dehalococcoidia bacterium]